MRRPKSTSPLTLSLSPQRLLKAEGQGRSTTGGSIVRHSLNLSEQLDLPRAKAPFSVLINPGTTAAPMIDIRQDLLASDALN